MSYWDREVCIWRINKRNNIDLEADESDGESEGQNRKLVARILVKGDANITSAAITTDGTLLTISTTNEVKIFHLRSRKSIDQDALKVSKVSTPSSFLSAGARMVEFSPDGKWLCVIRSDSRVIMARIQSSEASSITSPKILNTLTKLERLQRKHEKITSLGSYNRTITRAAFSSNGRVLAVSDLAGYVDTWVLEGVEDQTQEFIDAASDVGSDTSSNDESEDMSDDGEEDDEKIKGAIIFGQRWIPNPSASLVPCMPSSPIVISFRPAQQSTTTPKLLTNGSSIPHPTRSTPNPVSHTLDSQLTEDRLLIVTAKGQIYEFEVLTGALSSWSRRNPTERFPVAFRGIRDLAMGAVWDVTGDNQRVWLYGVSWLWMFDLSRDLLLSATTDNPSKKNMVSTQRENGAVANKGKNEKRKKRKRDNDDDEQDIPPAKNPKKGTSGAGSKVLDEELELGIGRKLLKIQYDEDDHGNETQRVETREIKRPLNIESESEDSNEEENEDEDSDIEMGGIHNKDTKAEALETGTRTDDEVDGNASDQQQDGHVNKKVAVGWWSTFKYRPMMGIVPISNGGEEGSIEVALVERPLWDVELPPRFYGDQEWEKPGL